MKVPNLKIARTVLFASALGVISLTFILIDAKSSLAGSYFNQSYTRCNKPVSVPEPYPFVGILAFGILGGGYLLKQRLRKKGDCLNNNGLLPIDDFSLSNNQQSRQISFIDSVEKSEENYYHLSPDFELQLIGPTEII
ncbi:hypothetical protein [Tolypothrix sp. VBCCA 56010]|uniref:hypothetical protein n=1 Tax=Tolypothrix sp. VBCCA 56010 TaxID=3137731 RepID=UPI003D7E52D0